MSKIINGKENLINYFQKKFTLKKNSLPDPDPVDLLYPDPCYFIKDSMKTYKGQYFIKFNDLLHIFSAATKMSTQDPDP
jgi:hypothetical protein